MLLIYHSLMSVANIQAANDEAAASTITLAQNGDCAACMTLLTCKLDPTVRHLQHRDFLCYVFSAVNASAYTSMYYCMCLSFSYCATSFTCHRREALMVLTVPLWFFP